MNPNTLECHPSKPIAISPYNSTNQLSPFTKWKTNIILKFGLVTIPNWTTRADRQKEFEYDEQ